MLAFFLAVIFCSGPISTTLLWLCGIRPWLRRIGKPVITGANWGQSAWGDWTMAREACRERNKTPWFVWAFVCSIALWIVGPVTAIGIGESIGAD